MRPGSRSSSREHGDLPDVGRPDWYAGLEVIFGIQLCNGSKRRKPRWLAACHRGSAMEGVAPSEMPRLLVSCVRIASPDLEGLPCPPLIPRSSELRGSLPLKGDATALSPQQSGLERTYFTVSGDLRREGRGHGEEDIWKAWVGDHRLDGCRGDCGEPFGCGCLEDAAAFGQHARCGSGSGSSGPGVGVRFRQLGRS